MTPASPPRPCRGGQAVHCSRPLQGGARAPAATQILPGPGHPARGARSTKPPPRHPAALRENLPPPRRCMGCIMILRPPCTLSLCAGCTPYPCITCLIHPGSAPARCPSPLSHRHPHHRPCPLGGSFFLPALQSPPEQHILSSWTAAAPRRPGPPRVAPPIPSPHPHLTTGAESKGTAAPGEQGQLRARARILEDRGSSPRPAPHPWEMTHIADPSKLELAPLSLCHGPATPACQLVPGIRLSGCHDSGWRG